MKKQESQTKSNWLLTFVKQVFFQYMVFLSRTFPIHRTGKRQVGGGGYLLNSSLTLPPTSQVLRQLPGNCCREFLPAYYQQLDSNWKPLVSEGISATAKLRTPKKISIKNLVTVFLFKDSYLNSQPLKYLVRWQKVNIVSVWVLTLPLPPPTRQQITNHQLKKLKTEEKLNKSPQADKKS